MRILHVTHKDMDAVGCDVIVRIYCKENLGIDASSDEIKTCWCTATGASDTIIKEIEAIRCNAQQRMPTNIFISDISITEECAKMLEKLSEMYGFEVKLFDHHATNKLSEIFPWCKVVLSSPPISATMILRNELLGSIDADKYPGIDEFCDKVSRYDTWMWKKNPRDYSEEDYNMAVEASEILFGKSTKESLLKLDEKTLLEVFDGVPQFEVSRADLEAGVKAVDLFTDNAHVFPSKGEMRKLTQGGGISINKEKLDAFDKVITTDYLLDDKYILVQKGKKNYYLVIAK